MRIVHALPVVSADAAFGGPVSVAVAQATALIGRGHDVAIAAGWLGSDGPPSEIEGVQAHLFAADRMLPVGGFSVFRSSGLTSWYAENCKAIDVLHLHSGRHWNTLVLGRIAARRRRPYVVQSHGMFPPASRLPERAFDVLLSRSVLTRAGRVLFLTERESLELSQQFGDRVSLKMLRNGIEVEDASPLQEPPGPPEVLFLGRLHERKRPLDLVRAVAAVRRMGGPELRLAFVGPDEGQLEPLRREIAALDLTAVTSIDAPLPHAQVRARMRQAAVFALPSVDEPFPMAVLEAMSLGVPVVVTTGCGIAEELSSAAAATVVQPNVESLAHGLLELLNAREKREQQTCSAFRLMRERFSLERVVDTVETVYAELTP